MLFFDAHAVLFTVRIWGAFCYETCRVNGIALILVNTYESFVKILQKIVGWEKRISAWALTLKGFVLLSQALSRRNGVIIFVFGFVFFLSWQMNINVILNIAI